MSRVVHFVGFRTNAEYLAAVRVFGHPNFIHLIHDRRMYGDTGYPICPADTLVVFARKASLTVEEYVDQDHMRH